MEIVILSVMVRYNDINWSDFTPASSQYMASHAKEAK